MIFLAAYRTLKLAMLLVMPLVLAIPVGRVLEVIADGKRQSVVQLNHKKGKMKLAHPATLAPQTSMPREEKRETVIELVSSTQQPLPLFDYLFSIRAVTRDVPTPPPRAA
jgi:hypothetical protein